MQIVGFPMGRLILCIFIIISFPTDPKADTTLKIDGKEVVVPQGKPKSNPEGSGSHFGQSEYLIYKESQNRIRYLLLMDF